MHTSVTQRWRDRRGSYRPAGETIRTSDYDVALIDSDRIAKAFVERHHYSASFPAARARVGLYRHAELVGVLVASQPAHNAVLDCLPGSDRATKAELGRLVLLDAVPSNGETWFMARAFALLAKERGIESLVSFSDPVPRTDAVGRATFPGHVGTIYQAFNASFQGRGSPGRLRLLPDGSVLSKRAISKIRARERGCDYAAALLEKHGAAPLKMDEDSAAWLGRWLPRLTRVLPHPGNYRYLFGLSRAVRKHLPTSLPYPKVTCAQVGLGLT